MQVQSYFFDQSQSSTKKIKNGQPLETFSIPQSKRVYEDSSNSPKQLDFSYLKQMVGICRISLGNLSSELRAFWLPEIDSTLLSLPLVKPSILGSYWITLRNNVQTITALKALA